MKEQHSNLFPFIAFILVGIRFTFIQEFGKKARENKMRRRYFQVDG